MGPPRIFKLFLGGPSHSSQATSSQENYFYFYVEYKILWDIYTAGPGRLMRILDQVITAGESLAIAGPTGPDRVHRQHNNERKV